MTSNRPYLVRALRDWIIDNEMTPYILVDAEVPEVEVPKQYVAEGKVVLNLSPTAIDELSMEGDYISFDARFSGRSYSVILPVMSVIAIYAQENGKGMVFSEEDPDADPSPPSGDDKKSGRKPNLTLVQ